MKSVFKKSLAVVLTAVMIFSVISVTAFATDEVSDYPAITLGQEQVVNIETKDDEKFFVYIPEKTGGYIFESFAEKPKDTFGTVYNSNMKRLFSNDEDGIDSNFRIMLQLTAGKTYYFSVRFYDDDLGEIPFKLSSIDSSVLELKKEAEVEITTQGQVVYFEYTPTVTETYIFKSISDNKDTVATVYNSNFSIIAYNDDSAMDNNFYVEVTLKAGETYYFAVSLYNSSSLLNFSVLLTMVESPFESIQINPVTLTEGVDGYYNEYWDESSGEKIKYFEYDWPNYISYTVKLKNGQEINGEGYSFKYQNIVYNFSFNDNQTPYNPWKPDNIYTVKISVEKLSDEMEISIIHNYQDANCTTPKKCEACGETLGDALGHTYDNDCDTTCNVCQEVRNISHDFRWVIDEENNCGKDGKQHQECSVCGVVQNENTLISATGDHTYDNDCDTTCNVCGNERTITHDYKWIVDQMENCGVNGSKHEECSICGVKQNENTLIPATNNHTYDNGCDTECNVCTKTREVDNHQYTHDADKICNSCGFERAVVGQHLIKEDDATYYYADGEKTNITSLVKINGKWHYIKGGKFASNETTLVKYNGKWYHVKNGLKTTSTTLVKYNGKWYYVEKGVKSTKTTLVKYNGTWYYVKSGVKNTATTLVKYNGKYYYVEKGIKKTATKLVKYNGSYYYVKSGKWDSSAKGIIKISGKYYYIKGGKWSKTTTLYKKSGKYYAVKSGMWYKSKAIIKYNGKKYYVNKGYAQTKYSGKVTISGKKYTVKRGIVK